MNVVDPHVQSSIVIQAFPWLRRRGSSPKIILLASLLAILPVPAEAQWFDKVKGFFADKPESCTFMKGINEDAVTWDYACGTDKPPKEIDPRYMAKSPYEGHWDVVFQDCNHLAEAFIIVNKGMNGLGIRDPEAGLFSSGLIRHTGATEANLHHGHPELLPDGSLQDSFGAWGWCNCIPLVTRVRPSGDPNVLIGQWTIEDEKGVTIWRRRPPAKIESVLVHSGVMNEEGGLVDDFVDIGERPARIERDHPLTCGFGGMRGNCPRVFISVRGTNFAGAHDIWLDPASSMEVDPYWECDDGSVYNSGWYRCTYDKPYGHRNTGLQFRLTLWDGIKPGVRTIWVDGQPIPIELIIHGHPDVPEVALTFKEKKDGSWVTANAQGVAYGSLFKVEAEFRDAPTEMPVVVQLKWDDKEEPVGVTVNAVNGADKLFRSQELALDYKDGRAVLTRIPQ